MVVCSKCGSTEIQTKEWVEFNTGKCVGTASEPGNIDDQYCPACEEKVGFTDTDVSGTLC